MLLREARAYRDRLRAKDTAATVPTGHSPYGYYVKVWPGELRGVALRLTTEAECDAFIERVARNKAACQELLDDGNCPKCRAQLSAMERMIDEAVKVGQDGTHCPGPRSRCRCRRNGRHHYPRRGCPE